MRRSQVYHGWRRVAYSSVGLVVLAILILLMGRSTWRVYNRWDKSRQDNTSTKARHEAELARQAKLEEDLKRLSTERGLEEEIRRSFQVAKPGEGVLIIVGTSTR